MKILSNEEYDKLKSNEEIKRYLTAGYNANMLCLAFERKPIHFSRLDMNLLQAVNQQVKELGWGNDILY